MFLISNLKSLDNLLSQKFNLCNYQVDFISAGESLRTGCIPDHGNFQNLKKIQEAWEIIRGIGKTNMVAQKKAWAEINEIGEEISTKGFFISSLLRRYRTDSSGNRFFILLTGQEPDGFPKFEINFLCNLCQVQHGKLPIHAAGVIHKKKLLLFAGRSGAGKSTISKLLVKTEDKILDEDQVLIRPLSNKTYSADAWGYSLKRNSAPICGIFKLIQARQNSILPLTQAQTARLIFEQVNQAAANMIPIDLYKTIFERSADIARKVPGFELHFRKSPDFWKLIDECIPD